MLREHLDVGIYGISDEIEQFTDLEALDNNLIKLPEDKRPKSEEEWIETYFANDAGGSYQILGERTREEPRKS